MKLKYIILTLRDQLPFKRLVRNVLNGSIRGVFHNRAHLTNDGNPKVRYNTKASADRAAKSMSHKQGVAFANYRCPWCGGYHIGKNVQPILEADHVG
jgi:protein-disulfide isomerase